jgi:hypothetical protein
VWDGASVRGRWYLYGPIAALPFLLVAAFLGVWLIPSGPGITGGAGNSSFLRGYAGNHYSIWTVFGVRESFVVKQVKVATNDAKCHGTVRLVGKPVLGGYLAGVSRGPLPGASIIGRRLTPQLGQQLALVLTPSSTGRCQAVTIRVADHAWGRTRWTTLPSDFSVTVTHKTGQDSRAKEASPPTL